MKKLLILVTTFLFIGCMNNEKSLNLENVSKDIDNLEVNEINLTSAVNEIEATDSYDKMEYVLEDDLKNMGITLDNIDKYVIRKSTDESEKTGLYMIIKPKEDRIDVVKEEINNYLTKKTNEELDEKDKKLYEERIEKEYDGYLIYIIGEDNKNILNIILDNKEKIFTKLVSIKDEDIKKEIGINSSDIEESLIKLSGDLESANMYMIIKCDKNKLEDLDDSIDEYLDNLEEKWKDNNEQYELVKNHLKTKLDNYIILIISNDNERVLKTIKENFN